MREIFLFRGKRLDNGEWVEGFYISDLAGKAYICKKVTAMYTFDGARCYGPFIEVDPDTLGRETGLTDKKGKKVFEGDIVRANNGHVGYIKFQHGQFGIRCKCHPNSFNAFYSDNEIVIGNVVDNPELLERGRE